MQMHICFVENQCSFVHILMHILPFSTFWSNTSVMTNSSVCTAFKAHYVILLHMTKAAFQTFWHSLPTLALHHVSTQATEACAFIVVLFMEILGMITSSHTASHFYIRFLSDLCTLKLECTNPGHQVTWMTEFCMVMPKTCGSLICNLLHLTLLVSGILR